MKALSLLFALVVVACGNSESTTATGSDGGASSSGSSTSSSGSTTSSSSGSAASQEDAYCAARASHATCHDGSTLSCDDEGKCIYGRLMSKTAADAYNACYAAPSCRGDDECAAEAGKTAGGAAAEKYSADCQAKLTECPDTGLGELCGTTIYAYPSVIDAAVACLAKSCAELKACFQAAIAPISNCKN